MEEISKIKLGSKSYVLKDSEARLRSQVFPLFQCLALSGIPHNTSIQDSPEWMMLLVDSENKILAGIRHDGTAYCGYDDVEKLFETLLEMYDTTSSTADSE